MCDFSAPFYGFALEEVIWTQRYLHRSLHGAEDRQKTGVLYVHVCSFFQATGFRAGSNVDPGDTTLSRSYSSGSNRIKAQWTGAEDRHSKRHVCRRPGFFSAGIKGLWSNTKTLTLKWRMAASWAAHL